MCTCNAHIRGCMFVFQYKLHLCVILSYIHVGRQCSTINSLHSNTNHSRLVCC
uniref:Uncharacterized protein n=1 Tax=Anguilla anguilla TaxID=7936 RepID=A0A0E9S7Z8_ANGAN